MADMTAAQYLLRWNDHLNNYSDVFLSLREEEKFFDCSLACEDGVVGSHRVVLAGCSHYLRDLFLRLNNPHPIIFLVNTPRSLILLLMEFIYRGEVHIPQNKLEQLVTLGQSLKIKGLTQIALPPGLPKHSTDHNTSPVAFPQGFPLSTLETLPCATGSRGVSNISLQTCDDDGNNDFDEDSGGEDEKVTTEMETADTPVTTPAAIPTPTTSTHSYSSVTPVIPHTAASNTHRPHRTYRPSLKLLNPYVKLTDALASTSNGGVIGWPMRTPGSTHKPIKVYPRQENYRYYNSPQEKMRIGEFAVTHGIEAAKKQVNSEYNVSIKDSTLRKFMSIYRKQKFLEN